MEEIFNAEFFAANRQRLRKLFSGTAPIVLTANGLMQHTSDSTYPFKQDSNFWYLTGIDEPDVVLVMDKDKEYIIVPDRETVRDTFDGAIDIEYIKTRSGISEVIEEMDGWKRLTSRIKKVKHVATIAPPPAYVPVFGFYTNPARQQLALRIKDINSAVELLDLRQQLAVMRMVKQAPEIAAVQQAIDITSATLKDVRKKLSTFQWEYEIEARITHGFRSRGAQGHAFTPVVAAGPHTSTIHYVKNAGPIAERDIVLLDVGAEVSNYAADISRTYVVGEPKRNYKKVYDVVVDVQDYATALIKPGITLRAYEKQIEQYMGEKLRSLGLIKNVEHDEIRRYFPHATSHFLGLDTHDIGDYDRPLEPGVILTVEPGIYVPEQGFGIRIEDDVLVTEDGAIVMSKKLPRGL
jgi:Xaa-Pro aminopeptidase